MALCRKIVGPIDSKGNVMRGGLQFQCDLTIPDGQVQHDGPCSSRSDTSSGLRRVKWESEEKKRLEKERHSQSALARTQSVPMTSQDFLTADSAMFSLQEVQCPHCSDMPMAKNLMTHLRAHQMESDAQEISVRKKSASSSDFIAPERKLRADAKDLHPSSVKVAKEVFNAPRHFIASTAKDGVESVSDAVVDYTDDAPTGGLESEVMWMALDTVRHFFSSDNVSNIPGHVHKAWQILQEHLPLF